MTNQRLQLRRAQLTMSEVIALATSAGYQVLQDPETGEWSVLTPKTHRRPSQALGAYRHQQSAWRDAAMLALTTENQQ